MKCSPTYEPDVLSRGKRSIALDLKKSEGVAIVRAMCKSADVLIEPFRAGRVFGTLLNLGPDSQPQSIPLCAMTMINKFCLNMTRKSKIDMSSYVLTKFQFDLFSTFRCDGEDEARAGRAARG